VEVAKIKPVVDRSFPLGDAPEAYRYFEAGKHFGKVTLACD
jgi:NADPH:quinone reductase-like Zn-dependent oxidoreductase